MCQSRLSLQKERMYIRNQNNSKWDTCVFPWIFDHAESLNHTLYTWSVAGWLSHSHGVWLHNANLIHTPAQGTLTLHLSKTSVIQAVRYKVTIYHWGDSIRCKISKVKLSDEISHQNIFSLQYLQIVYALWTLVMFLFFETGNTWRLNSKNTVD
jgi:hypothetical protein